MLSLFLFRGRRPEPRTVGAHLFFLLLVLLVVVAVEAKQTTRTRPTRLKPTPRRTGHLVLSKHELGGAAHPPDLKIWTLAKSFFVIFLL